MSKRAPLNITPEILTMEIPKRRVRIGLVTRALMEMEVSKSEPLFFALPEGLDMVKFSGQMGSYIASARKFVDGSSFSKRMVEFAEGDGIAVWRLK